MKKTKIVCTIGPATDKKETLEQLITAGMNVMRLNFSHGNHPDHTLRIKDLREVSDKLDKKIAILLDTKGPEIRTIKLENGKDVTLKAGQKFTITTDEKVIGNSEIVAVTYKGLTKDLKPGNIVLLDDGLVGLTVEEIKGNQVICVVNNTGELGENKGVNLPGVSVNLPALADKDIADLKFGCEQGVDFVAASFIRKASDVREVRKVLDTNGGKNIQIISKIENQEGVDNFDEILELSDGIMVARGDLGVEIPVEEVPVAQKMMIEKCNTVGKVVITATQMLDSMIKNPRPTRAEAGDVANAIIDGTDAVMLSGETAKGKYPVEAVTIMAQISDRMDGLVKAHNMDICDKTIPEAIANGTVDTAEKLGAALIVVATTSGRAAKALRRYFPSSNILAITNNDQTSRQLALTRGTSAVVEPNIKNLEEFYYIAEVEAKKRGFAKTGDIIIANCGDEIFKSGTSNSFKAIIVR